MDFLDTDGVKHRQLKDGRVSCGKCGIKLSSREALRGHLKPCDTDELVALREQIQAAQEDLQRVRTALRSILGTVVDSPQVSKTGFF